MLIIVGTVMAIITGGAFPISFIVFGKLTDIFIENSRMSYLNISNHSKSSHVDFCKSIPKVCVVFFLFLSSRLCFFLNSDLTLVGNNTLQDEMRGYGRSSLIFR